MKRWVSPEVEVDQDFIRFVNTPNGLDKQTSVSEIAGVMANKDISVSSRETVVKSDENNEDDSEIILLFQNYNDMQRKMMQTTLWNSAPDPTIPSPEQELEWIKIVITAIKSTKVAKDSFQSKKFGRMADYYRDAEIESIARLVVRLTISVHKLGWKCITIWDKELREEITRTSHYTFEYRMGGIIQLLRESKQTCEALLKREKIYTVIGVPYKLLGAPTPRTQQSDHQGGYPMSLQQTANSDGDRTALRIDKQGHVSYQATYKPEIKTKGGRVEYFQGEPPQSLQQCPRMVASQESKASSQPQNGCYPVPSVAPKRNRAPRTTVAARGKGQGRRAHLPPMFPLNPQAISNQTPPESAPQSTTQNSQGSAALDAPLDNDNAMAQTAASSPGDAAAGPSSNHPPVAPDTNVPPPPVGPSQMTPQFPINPQMANTTPALVVPQMAPSTQNSAKPTLSQHTSVPALQPTAGTFYGPSLVTTNGPSTSGQPDNPWNRPLGPVPAFDWRTGRPLKPGETPPPPRPVYTGKPGEPLPWNHHPLPESCFADHLRPRGKPPTSSSRKREREEVGDDSDDVICLGSNFVRAPSGGASSSQDTE